METHQRRSERGGVMIFSIMVLVFVGGITGGFQTLMLKAVVATSNDFDDEEAFAIASYAFAKTFHEILKDNSSENWKNFESYMTFESNSAKQWKVLVRVDSDDDAVYDDTDDTVLDAGGLPNHSVFIYAYGRVLDGNGAEISERQIVQLLRPVTSSTQTSALFRAGLETSDMSDPNSLSFGSGTGGGYFYSFDSNDGASGSAWDVLKTYEMLGEDYDSSTSGNQSHYGTFDKLAKSWGDFQGGAKDTRKTHWYGAVETQTLSTDGTAGNDPALSNVVWADANDDGLPELDSITVTTFDASEVAPLSVDAMIDWMQDSNNGVATDMQPRDFSEFETMITDGDAELNQEVGTTTNGWALTNVSGYNESVPTYDFSPDYPWSDFVDASGNLVYDNTKAGKYTGSYGVTAGGRYTLEYITFPAGTYYFNSITVGGGREVRFEHPSKIFVAGTNASGRGIDLGVDSGPGVIKGEGDLDLWVIEDIVTVANNPTWIEGANLQVTAGGVVDIDDNDQTSVDKPGLHSTAGDMTLVSTRESADANDTSAGIEYGSTGGDITVAAAGVIGAADNPNVQAAGRFDIYTRSKLHMDRGFMDSQDASKRSFLYINGLFDGATGNLTEYNNNTLQSPENLMVFVKGRDVSDPSLLLDAGNTDGSHVTTTGHLELNGVKNFWGTIWAPDCIGHTGGTGTTIMGAMVSSTFYGAKNLTAYWDQKLGAGSSSSSSTSVDSYTTGAERER